MVLTTTSPKYEMWLTYNAENEKIQFPVLPQSLQIKSGSKNESVSIVGLGEIFVTQGRPAYRFSFSSFFPAAKFPGLQVATVTPPLTLIKKINTWKESGKPIHFIVTACGVDIYTVIDDFSYSEEGGDPGTYQYSITLKEYRAVTVRQVTVDIPKATATVKKEEPRVDNTVKPKTYTVVRGDCLSFIAKKFYGSQSQWRKIYDANKSVIGGNPNLIYAGQVYAIP